MKKLTYSILFFLLFVSALSNDFNDIQPLLGTEWEFKYKIQSNFIDELKFESSPIKIDGVIGIEFECPYGNGVVFWNDELKAYDAVCGIDVYYHYIFNVSGSNATGVFYFKNYPTIDMTGYCLNCQQDEKKEKLAEDYLNPYSGCFIESII